MELWAMTVLLPFTDSVTKKESRSWWNVNIATANTLCSVEPSTSQSNLPIIMGPTDFNVGAATETAYSQGNIWLIVSVRNGETNG